MEKRYFIKVVNVVDENNYYINYYGQDSRIIALDYKHYDRHNVITMRSDYIKRHGYKTQGGAERSYFYKHYADNSEWKAEIIWYYC